MMMVMMMMAMMMMAMMIMAMMGCTVFAVQCHTSSFVPESSPLYLTQNSLPYNIKPRKTF